MSEPGRDGAGAARTAAKARGQKAGATRGRAASATARKKGTAGSGGDVPEPPSPLQSALDALLAAASAAQQVQPCEKFLLSRHADSAWRKIHVCMVDSTMMSTLSKFPPSPHTSAVWLQVPQLVSKACRQLAQVLAQSGCPAAALLALHDCHGAAVRQQFAAVVRGKQLALARRADAEGPHAVAVAAAGFRAVELQLRHAWRDMQQLPLQHVEVRVEVEYVQIIQQGCPSGGCRCAPDTPCAFFSLVSVLHVLETA